jgi:hypothetical protein
MLNPSAGQGQGRTIDRTPLDAFVHHYLASVLMKMKPRDGASADPAQTWCLADDADQHMLLYSLAGETIRLRSTLRGDRYAGLWFDPRSGETSPAGEVSVEIRKPSSEPWLLLLTAR